MTRHNIPKILLVASPSSFTEQLKLALKANGAEVFYLNDRENNLIFWPLRNNAFLWRAVRRIQPLRVANNRLFEQRLLKAALKVKPNLIFLGKGMTVKKGLLTSLRKLGIKTANWFPEYINREPYRSWFLSYYKLFDYFFVYDSWAKELVKNQPESNNIIYLPMAVDPDAYVLDSLSEADKKKYGCDVCFVGALYPERERYLKIVQKTGVNLKIYGWKGWEKTSLASHYHGPLNLRETVKLYNCAKICLNINIEPAANGVNFRTFEIPAAGGFQLSDYRKDLNNLFDIGKEIVCFNNEEELRQKIKFYLANDEIRINLARGGYERVQRDHTLVKRINAALKMVGV